MSAAETPNDISISQQSHHQTPSSPALLIRLQQILSSCSQSVEFETSNAELTCFLDSVSNSALANPDDKLSNSIAFEILSELLWYLSSHTLDQPVVDALSFELPKAVAKFAGVSASCLEVADAIIDRLVTTCSPRDMLSILCEALDHLSKMLTAPSCIAPLLTGLSKGACFN